MERRLVLFFIISSGILLLYSMLAPRPLPPHQPQKQVAHNEPAKGGGKAGEKHPENGEQPKPAAQQPGQKLAGPKNPAAVIKAAPQPAVPEQWVMLGSADHDDPYRMLVTLANKGAAVARIELNSPYYCDIDHRHGYLGHLVLNPLGPGKGCRVQAVGPGTPAAKAGLQLDDVVKSFAGQEVADADSLEALVAKTKPGQTVQIVFTRGKQQITKPAKLTRIPLEVIRPEHDDPLSMLLTLDTVDGLKLATQWLRDSTIYGLYSELKLSEREIADLNKADVNLKQDESKIRIPGESANEKHWIAIPDDLRKSLVAWLDKRGDKAGPLFCRLPLAAEKEKLTAENLHKIIARVRVGEDWKNRPSSFFELEGLNLLTANWQVVPSGDRDVAKFRYVLPEKDLEIIKTYRLVKVPAESQKDESYRGYHLEFEIEIRNVAKTPGESHSVAYRLDGPNGLPTEGAWYASRVTRCGGMGLREYIISTGEQTPEMQDAVTIAGGAGKSVSPTPDQMLTFIGVDAQYFSAVLMPQRKNPQEAWFQELMPICVGKVDAKQQKLANTSCRLVSELQELKPGETLTRRFTFFTGPKKEAIVKPYGLGDLIYFGWPIYKFVAVPLTYILHFFYAVVGNYGLAIILLTVLVRGCMFPLSLKQAAGAQKMQMLQPELKKLQEKHKGNTEARAKAQQELFRKHSYNPLSGCLPIFIQMPVFIGLYRSLMVAIELRDAPLFTNSIRWCSNLAGPDMLFDWHAWWPQSFNEGAGMFALGPYFNLLPLLTIVLFIVQQKMFMPPPTDEQAAMTQKMMKYMMVFMGVLFYKVASGLCIYFIASSLWGLAERRFLPKTTPPAGSGGGGMETRAEARARERAEAAKKKK
jgi:YidC/Oxa1 family membrane protein insertase